MQKRKSNHHQKFQVRAKKLAEFISTAEAEEVLLAQRLRDNQGKEVFKVIDFERDKINKNESLNLPHIEAVEQYENDSSMAEKIDKDIQISSLQIFDSY